MWVKITTEIGEREELSIKIIVLHFFLSNGIPMVCHPFLYIQKKKTKYGLHYDIYDFPV